MNNKNLALTTAHNMCNTGDVGGLEHNTKTIEAALKEEHRNGATLYAMTVREVAAEMGISKTLVSKLEKRALNKVRELWNK